MIIIDFNGVVVGQILSQKNGFDEDMMRHQILNTLRMYNHKFRKEYGDMIIALDSKSWRKTMFPEYKANRKKIEKDNQEKFDTMFSFLDIIKQEIKDCLPYKTVSVNGAEADDIIATLCHESQEFGQYEPIMIVSSDKDFIQLHKYSNVKQYSPMNKKYITDDNPDYYIFKHILKGDSSDGVPNILSADNALVEGIRQKPMTNKRITALWESRENLKSHLTVDEYRNYIRNEKMISLDKIPNEIKQKIVSVYKETTVNANKMTTLNYLIQKRCKLLVACVDEFY